MADPGPVLHADIVRTLRGFSLAVQFTLEREVLVLFGPSGSGKSLTLQALAGVDRPDGGRITVSDGDSETVLFDAARGVNVKPQARHLGYVPQSLGLFPHLSVVENVTYGLRGRDKAQREATARRLLALMRLRGLDERRPGQLSGGQRQRVALARALAVEPRLLLLDEPFTALEGPTRRALGEEVRRLHEDRGMPVVLVTHDIDEAFALGDRIAVLDAGRVLQIGGRVEVFTCPATRRVAELVGVENILPGIVRGRGPQDSTVVEWGPVALQVATPPDAVPLPGEAVDLAIAASQIMVLKEPNDPLAAPLGAEGRPNVIRCRTIREEIGRDTMRLDLQPLPSPELPPLRLELPAYVYYRLGLDTRRTFAVQLKPASLHL
ncbi:MAG: ABC transporter ATP-binding protein, partial [Dehalococcoidia bacterium]